MGDNFVMILVLLLRLLDVIVSLGISMIFLMSMLVYKLDLSYYFFNYLIMLGQYMFMLCYKNGGLVREKVCDVLFSFEFGDVWENFNKYVFEIVLLDV